MNVPYIAPEMLARIIGGHCVPSTQPMPPQQRRLNNRDREVVK